MANTDSIVTIKIDGADEFFAQLEIVFNATYELQISRGWVAGPSLHQKCRCTTGVDYNGIGIIKTYSVIKYCPLHWDVPVYG